MGIKSNLTTSKSKKKSKGKRSKPTAQPSIENIEDDLEPAFVAENPESQISVSVPESCETAEEYLGQLRDSVTTLKDAVMRKEVVVIQEMIITIVRTVTLWLEKIEYRVYTIKQTTNVNRRVEEIRGLNQDIQVLNEEILIMEESLQMLEEATEQGVKLVNEETKLLLQNCVSYLRQQVQSVKELTKRSEHEIHPDQHQSVDVAVDILSKECEEPEKEPSTAKLDMIRPSQSFKAVAGLSCLSVKKVKNN